MHAICADFKGSGGVSHEFWAKMPKNDPRAQKYYLRLMVDSQESILFNYASPSHVGSLAGRSLRHVAGNPAGRMWNAPNPKRGGSAHHLTPRWRGAPHEDPRCQRRESAMSGGVQMTIDPIDPDDNNVNAGTCIRRVPAVYVHPPVSLIKS